MKVLELTPAPHEVALARLPERMAVTAPGTSGLSWLEWRRYVAVPGNGLGWGAGFSTWLSVSGIARYHHKRDRAVWQQAARILGDELADPSWPLVLYVVHEKDEAHGRPVWVAVRIRREGEQ